MKEKGIIFLFLILGLFFVFGCQEVSGDEELVVRVACFPNLTHAQGLVSISEGAFQQALGDDIKVEWKFFNSGNPEIEAFFAGELDIGFIGPIPAVNGFAKSGGEIKIISGAVNSGAVLIASAESEIRGIKDLDGKRVAIPSFGNTQDFMLRMMLDEVGLQETTHRGTVEIMPVRNPDLRSFFSQGHLDAAFVPEPWGSQLINEVGAKLVLDAKDTWRNGDYPTTVIIARQSFIDEHPEIVKEFLKTHIEITKEYKGQQELLLNVVNQEIANITGSNIADEILNQAFPRIIMTWNPEKEAIKSLATAMKSRDFIDQEIKMDELLDFSILNEILTEMGEDTVR